MQALNLTILGIIALSLDARDVNALFFYAVLVHLHLHFNTHAFEH